MKIIKQITSIVLASSIFVSAIPRAKANPAILAPAALCSTGLGCIFVGTVLIGGIVYYVWQLNGGTKVFADANGQVMKSEYLEDPEEFEKESIVNVYGSSLSRQQAEERCKRDVSLRGLEYVRVRRKTNGTYECIGK